MKKFVIFSFFIISNLISTTKIMAGCVPCPTLKVCENSGMTKNCRNLTVGQSITIGTHTRVYYKNNKELAYSNDDDTVVMYKSCDAMGNMYIVSYTFLVLLDKNLNQLLTLRGLIGGG